MQDEAQQKSKMAAKEVERQFSVNPRLLSSWTRAMRIADRLLAIANDDRQSSLEWAGKGLSKQIIIKGDLLDESIALEREQQRKPRKRRRSSTAAAAEAAPSAKMAKINEVIVSCRYFVILFGFLMLFLTLLEKMDVSFLAD